MKASVVIIEDIKEMSDLIQLYVKREGMDTKVFDNAEDALEYLKTSTPDLILLDINLPGMDGFEFLNIYHKQSDCPVLIVSARDSDEDIIMALGYGADEFVTKPFSPKVLMARIRALLRRKQSGSSSSSKNIIQFGPYTLNTESCLLKRDDERIHLSAKEFDILLYLINTKGKTSTPEEIYRKVWGSEFGDLTAVAVYVQRLRKKLEADPAAPHFIETVHGMGYRFVPDEEIKK
ncbi:MAG: response regulator transcription factor [Spirochaetia bacterium]|nr:response regulator transcription factor [Spirochaetia bacterium]MBP5739921.1 response regulator transcription factor [Spirochaetia bacterium]